jgi:hypothetical protein
VLDFFIGSSQFYISLAKNHSASILAKYCLDFQSCVTGSTIRNCLVGAIYKHSGIPVELRGKTTVYSPYLNVNKLFITFVVI